MGLRQINVNDACLFIGAVCGAVIGMVAANYCQTEERPKREIGYIVLGALVAVGALSFLFASYFLMGPVNSRDTWEKELTTMEAVARSGTGEVPAESCDRIIRMTTEPIQNDGEGHS